MFGDSRTAPPSNEDIARVSVAALADPARHNGKLYRPTVPELRCSKEIANAIARALGARSIKVLPTPVWLFMKVARLAGIPLDVTGRPAENFEVIARRYAALPENLPNFGNWLRQFTQFTIAPLIPRHNLERYDRELRRPFPSRPQLAAESDAWRREHHIDAQAKPLASVRSDHPVAKRSASDV